MAAFWNLLRNTKFEIQRKKRCVALRISGGFVHVRFWITKRLSNFRNASFVEFMELLEIIWRYEGRWLRLWKAAMDFFSSCHLLLRHFLLLVIWLLVDDDTIFGVRALLHVLNHLSVTCIATITGRPSSRNQPSPEDHAAETHHHPKTKHYWLMMKCQLSPSSEC